MLLSGLIVGFMIFYGMKRRDGKSDLERKDLEAKRDALIERLRIEGDPGERSRLEVEAAEVLKKLDGLGVGARPSGARAPEAAAPAPKSSAIGGFLWGAGSVAVLAGIGFFVMQSAKPKDEQSAAPMQQQQPQQQSDAQVRELEAAVQRNPSDLNARNDLAKAYLDRENMDGVVEQTQYVLQRSPEDARALTYEALVRIANNQPDVAKAMLERATKAAPDLIDAWVGLAWVEAQSGRMAEAEAAIGEAKKRRPDQAQRLDTLLQHIKPAEATNPIRITLNLAPGAKMPQQGIIYVMARAAGQASGPPIAVKRLNITEFPLTAEISSADSMSGEKLPEKVHIDVRLDTDGNAMTKTAGDLTAVQDGVAAGQTISLTLK
jgi:tetratricopeptide (TPR) repeat protein